MHLLSPRHASLNARAPDEPPRTAVQYALRLSVGESAVRFAAGSRGMLQIPVLDRLLDALLVAALRAAGPGIARQGDPLIDRVIEQLHANPRRPLSVEAMARSGALSRAAFSQRFSRRTGLGPGAYQRRLRLAWAADELRATARTVAAVGEDAGYGSPASFSSAFKQEYGQSPHGWRTRGGRGADRVY